MHTLNTLEAEAARLVGNWKKFDSFGWYDRPDDADQFTIVYTNTRDSSLLEQSNAAVIAAALEDDPDAIPERHSHWACGWIDGFAIRVYRDGQITEAFSTYCALEERLSGYPVLDESDLSEREYAAQNDAWDQWAARDFRAALEKLYQVELNDNDLWPLFVELAEAANEYWEEDYIDVDKVAKASMWSNIEPLLLRYSVTYNDVGQVTEVYNTEREALARVTELRENGYLGATCTNN